MPDLHYDDPDLAALYDITCGWSEDRDFYLALAGAPPETILDLGCGTGLLCSRYAARGHTVTGADPSPAMLDAARRQPGGDAIDWVLAPAQSFRSERRFDLIIMTGHAFQALETDAEILAGLKTMRDHLKPGGRAVFESRNPALDWAAKWQGNETRIDHRGIAGSNVSLRLATKVLGWEGDRLTFEQHFAFPDRTLVSTSTLRFATRAEIEALAAKAGLRTEALHGDWNKRPFDPVLSEEMIFTLRLT